MLDANYVYIISVECEWSEWHVDKECTKSCGGGKERHVRFQELTNKLKAQGYGSCRKLKGQETQGRVIDCNTHCCKGSYSLVSM